MYFLFGACVRTLRQQGQCYVLFLASMCFRIYRFVSFPIVFPMPNLPQPTSTRERNDFAVATFFHAFQTSPFSSHSIFTRVHTIPMVLEW
jgi:hypothetical protein